MFRRRLPLAATALLLSGAGWVASAQPPDLRDLVRPAFNAEYRAVLAEVLPRLELEPKNPVLNYYAGICSYFLDERENAKRFLRRSVDERAPFPEAYYWLVRLLAEEREWTEAHVVLRAGLGLFPANERLLLLASGSALGAGFRIEYLPAQTAAEIEIQDLLQATQRLHHIVRRLGETVRLPFPVRVEVGGPAEAPFYDASTRTVGLPYSFLAGEADISENVGAPDRKTLILDLAAFVFCHEVGHAVVHALGLHGRIAEERAADDLAVLMVTEFLEEGRPMAETLEALWTQDRRLPREPYGPTPEEWREEERRGRILCLLRGSDPAFHGETSAAVTGEKPGDCRGEYLRTREYWLETLTPLLHRPR